jgi:hypothetical protein
MIAILETTREIHGTRDYRQFKGAPRPEMPTHGHEAAQELLGWEARVYEMSATRWSAYSHETPSGQAAVGKPHPMKLEIRRGRDQQ